MPMYEISLDIETMLLRLLLAALLGGVIGWERERRNKQAGLKTHLLVSVGSALIMLTSIYGFDSALVNHPNARFDPARLAAQVVSGIGFLGAGAILRRSNHVISGLTTAATLWVAAAIGLAVGSGFYIPAVAVTALVLISTLVLNKLESKFLFIKKSGSLKIVIETYDGPVEVSRITELLHKANMSVQGLNVSDSSGDEDAGTLTMEFRVYASNAKGIDSLFERLWKVEGVKQVRMNWRDRE
ncbi:MgtC/SapB family protein [Paenibacillus sp. J5C_2022]|uniref:MgtC/SapB family protein n=1 Tax=Paenibacillus sp. J5C2022 TaxID=2977129 RepID=UPI0021CE34C9|nr:MgtC/SapB family protein [Paenibacillus sp. J5C2022]MCU6707798.1 MgtC/SapB family protein [Paenibacillus sp. J5C2022]